jgi:hypothetical protein
MTALRGHRNRSKVVVGNYCIGPITAEPCRAKADPLRPRRSCFAPAETRAGARAWVEAPGTAPGSERFIPIAVYRHSRPCGRHDQYREVRGNLKPEDNSSGQRKAGPVPPVAAVEERPLMWDAGPSRVAPVHWPRWLQVLGLALLAFAVLFAAGLVGGFASGFLGGYARSHRYQPAQEMMFFVNQAGIYGVFAAAAVLLGRASGEWRADFGWRLVPLEHVQAFPIQPGIPGWSEACESCVAKRRRPGWGGRTARTCGIG